ncbi:MAG TPA: Zn-dependent hydrolase [Candidatus Angelobacter sp.]|nr:Zn-dependent hydrolase [Candidatus Angelobacter sp.]
MKTRSTDPPQLSIDGARLLARLRQLGDTGRNAPGQLTRLAASHEDKLGRDLLVSWLRAAGLEVTVDAIGNIFGSWGADIEKPALMIGSHIDTVVDAGIYDGCYGVLAALAVIGALKTQATNPDRPVILAAFTNEEGVRYQPDMMGSLVYAGGYDLDAALSAIGSDGTVLGQELKRIGYAGASTPRFPRPAMYLELHIEQGPILEREGCTIGAVQDLQGISWQRVTINGAANHAGTTPIALRRDAGLAAARVITFLRDSVIAGQTTVATVGTIRFEPDAINIIPSRAVFTIDLRDPDEQRLQSAEHKLTQFLKQLEQQENVTIEIERIVRFEPVIFDQELVQRIEQTVERRGLKYRRMTSGAGHDAQMMARICPAAMIFVPSHNGISHNPL